MHFGSHTINIMELLAEIYIFGYYIFFLVRVNVSVDIISMMNSSVSKISIWP